MRYQDWPRRLNALIADRQSKPFKWGENDCCLFAADAAKALTGIDPAANLRGTYDSELSAARVIKAHGSVRELAAEGFGEEIPPLMAQRGDVVLYHGPLGDALAVCIGVYCAAPGDNGLVSIPLSSAVTAWRV